MFDSVLLRDKAPKSRVGAGAAATVLVHLAVFAAAAWFGGRPAERSLEPAEVKLFAGRPAAAPAPAPVAAAAAQAPVEPPKAEKKPQRQPKKELVAPKELPTEKPKEAEPEPAAEPEPSPAPARATDAVGTAGAGADPAGPPGGSTLGAPGGVPGGSGTEVLAFGEGMTRPANIKSPPAFQCPREAKEAGVEGVVLASCTVTLEGTLRDCKLVRSLPFMDAVAMDLLARWKVGVVTFQGQPVIVNYKIPMRMVCK